MIPPPIEAALKKHFNTKALVFSRVGGGSINEAFSFELKNKKYFLKYNKQTKYPYLLKFELEGLKAIRLSDTIGTPEVLYYQQLEAYELLVLPFIAPQQPTIQFWQKFGQQLAHMHMATRCNAFGWPHNNYLGSLPQANAWEKEFIPFWTNQRIKPLLKRASVQGLLKSSDLMAFDQLFKVLQNIFPNEMPCLVHGDLWSGNFIANNDIGPRLIDPAIHYSLAETDLAFTHLFGGFAPEFYQAYFEVKPMEPGFKDRIGIYNLYPLLLHLSLFGKSYYASIKSIIRPFAKQK